ncbi:MAG: LytTR family transcriptional regulator [Flavobacteriales bacterium]|nr:LytTR family transcriptional regulator [Flavobacteriales bacterium]MCB9448253.1 LytTR family transcriptional regulator [Flavobacteriales bacterium]
MHPIFINTGKNFQRIDLSEVLWVEALKDYILLYTKEKRYIINRTMKEIERKLSPYGFCRVHRSYIVNLNHIKSIQASTLQIGEKEVPIGKLFRETLLDKVQKL